MLSPTDNQVQIFAFKKHLCDFLCSKHSEILAAVHFSAGTKQKEVPVRQLLKYLPVSAASVGSNHQGRKGKP